MVTKQTKFIIAIAVQLVIIFSIIVFKVATLTGGADVLLPIEPVDPRDPFRGDYLTFQYRISNVDAYLFDYSPIKNGDTVYVPLEQQGKYWEAVEGIQKTKPVDTEQIFIKGKIASGGLEGEMLPFETPTPGFGWGNQVHIVYGVEEYFIPEGVGQDFNFWSREAAAKVSIDKNGSAVLKQIYIDNKPWP